MVFKEFTECVLKWLLHYAPLLKTMWSISNPVRYWQAPLYSTTPLLFKYFNNKLLLVGCMCFATVHVGHPKNFYLVGGIIWKVWRGVWLWIIRGGNSQVMMGLVLRGYCSTYFPFTYLPMIFPSLSKSMMSQGLLSAVPFLSNYLECGRLSEFLLFLFFFVKFLCL